MAKFISIVPIINDDVYNIIILKVYQPLTNKFMYILPGGTVIPDELILDTCKRILHDTTGFNISSIDFSSNFLYQSPDESWSFVYTTINPKPVQIPYNEYIRPVIISQEDALRLILDPNNNFDVKTYLVLKSFMFGDGK